MFAGTKSRWFQFVTNQAQGFSKPELWFWAPIETAVLTIMALLIGFALSPTDPLFANASFPWIIMFSLLVTLRYGSFYGLVANLIPIFFYKNSIDNAAWTGYLSGNVLLIMLTGEFSRVWFTEKKRATEKFNYIGSRLEQVTSAYYLTKFSHQQLEQSMALKPVSLREIIESVRKTVIKEQGKLNANSLNQLLTMLSQYCGLINAAVFASTHSLDLENKALAQIGTPFTPNNKDPLLTQLRTHKNLRYQTIRDLASYHQSDYIAVCPIQSATGQIYAYLVVQDMIFSMLNKATMEILVVLLTYYANEIGHYQQTPELLSKYPECPSEFAGELLKLSKLYHHLNVESHLSFVHIPRANFSEFISLKLKENQRGLDLSWICPTPNYIVYFNLLPFSGISELVGYQKRIRVLFAQHLNLPIDQKKCFISHAKINFLSVIKFIEECINAYK